MGRVTLYTATDTVPSSTMPTSSTSVSHGSMNSTSIVPPMAVIGARIIMRDTISSVRITCSTSLVLRVIKEAVVISSTDDMVMPCMCR